MTPVGMLSRMASVKRRRRSSSRWLASISWVIWLKPRTSRPSSSAAWTWTRCVRFPLRTSRAASSSAVMGTLICLARNSAVQVATKITNRVIRDISRITCLRMSLPCALSLFQCSVCWSIWATPAAVSRGIRARTTTSPAIPAEPGTEAFDSNTCFSDAGSCGLPVGGLCQESSGAPPEGR